MSLLVLTHLDGPAVDAHVDYLRRLSPNLDIVVCHGGRREAYEAVLHQPALFVEEPALRGPPMTMQSYNELLTKLWTEHMAGNDRWEAVLLLEFDHIPLRPDFTDQVLRVLAETGADFLGVDCSSRANTNWSHYLRFREDEALLTFLRSISVRDEPERLFGCLGTGFVLRRDALAAFAALQHFEPCYVELYLPTVVHHLGFRVGDLSAYPDMTRAVRWSPVYSVAVAEALAAAGAVFVHPLKEGLPALPVAKS
jgi:hypothetical protein